MNTLTQNTTTANNQALVIGDFKIRQDEDGRYCINDLHKASGSLAKHKPSNFIRNQQAQDLIVEIERSENLQSADFDRCSNMSIGRKAVNIIKGGVKQGMYVVKEIVYAYAMWISAKFHLMVIRAYDAMVMQTKINTRQVITPEQKDTLQKIVDHKANGNNGLRPQIWIRHNRHFKINSYHELLAIHFDDAVKYLLEMDVKQKPEKQEVKSLPYPQEVVQVAQQIGREFKGGHYDSWVVNAKDGILSVMPLPQGYYPTMDLGEFAKRFDSVLDLLYGTDTLRVGRHYLSQRKAK